MTTCTWLYMYCNLCTGNFQKHKLGTLLTVLIPYGKCLSCNVSLLLCTLIGSLTLLIYNFLWFKQLLWMVSVNTMHQETDLTNVHGFTQGKQLFTFEIIHVYVQLSSIQYTGCITVHMYYFKSFLTKTDNSYILIWQLFI